MCNVKLKKFHTCLCVNNSSVDFIDDALVYGLLYAYPLFRIRFEDSEDIIRTRDTNGLDCDKAKRLGLLLMDRKVINSITGVG